MFVSHSVRDDCSQVCCSADIRTAFLCFVSFLLAVLQVVSHPALFFLCLLFFRSCSLFLSFLSSVFLPSSFLPCLSFSLSAFHSFVLSFFFCVFFGCALLVLFHLIKLFFLSLCLFVPFSYPSESVFFFFFFFLGGGGGEKGGGGCFLFYLKNLFLSAFVSSFSAFFFPSFFCLYLSTCLSVCLSIYICCVGNGLGLCESVN